jgi:drug/metabolite transporter (DMT)-like permease
MRTLLLLTLIAALLGYLVVGEVPVRGMILGGAPLLACGAWLTRETSRRHGRRTARGAGGG